MSNKLNSRRTFLSSLAILSAGTAMGRSITDWVDTPSTTNVQQLWKKFCRQQNGQSSFQTIHPNQSLQLPACKSHTHKDGSVVLFAGDQVLAQPVWIYWGRQQKPADVVIHLFENNAGQKKIATLNRYELDALFQLAQQQNESAILSRLASHYHSVDKDPSFMGLHAIRVNITANNETVLKGHSGIQAFAMKSTPLHTA